MCQFYSCIYTADGNLLHEPNNHHEVIASFHKLPPGGRSSFRTERPWYEAEATLYHIVDGQRQPILNRMCPENRESVPDLLIKRWDKKQDQLYEQVVNGGATADIRKGDTDVQIYHALGTKLDRWQVCDNYDPAVRALLIFLENYGPFLQYSTAQIKSKVIKRPRGYYNGYSYSPDGLPAWDKLYGADATKHAAEYVAKRMVNTVDNNVLNSVESRVENSIGNFAELIVTEDKSRVLMRNRWLKHMNPDGVEKVEAALVGMNDS